MRSESLAKIATNALNLQNLIISCEIPDTADNSGCRFWNIFTCLVILRMGRQLHALKISKM